MTWTLIRKQGYVNCNEEHHNINMLILPRNTKLTAINEQNKFKLRSTLEKRISKARTAAGKEKRNKPNVNLILKEKSLADLFVQNMFGRKGNRIIKTNSGTTKTWKQKQANKEQKHRAK